METKEDILDVFTVGKKGIFNNEVYISFDDALKAMQEYADQQTEQLKKQLEEKDRDIESIKVVSDFQKYAYEQLQSKLSEKDKELSELKAKHKEEIDSIWGKYRYETNNEDAWSFKEWLKEYYTQTHGQ
jgi:chromosome segregation ATPase